MDSGIALSLVCAQPGLKMAVSLRSFTLAVLVDLRVDRKL